MTIDIFFWFQFERYYHLCMEHNRLLIIQFLSFSCSMEGAGQIIGCQPNNGVSAPRLEIPGSATDY